MLAASCGGGRRWRWHGGGGGEAAAVVVELFMGGAGRAACRRPWKFFRCRSWRFLRFSSSQSAPSWCEQRQVLTGVAVPGQGCWRARVARGVQYIDKVLDVPVVMQSCSACVRQSTGAFERISYVFYVKMNLDPEVDSLLALEIWISTSPLYLASHFPRCSCVQFTLAFGRISVFLREGGLPARFAHGNLDIYLNEQLLFTPFFGLRLFGR